MNRILIAKTCGTTFAAISMYCSALLWWSFAESTIDQVIAAVIGGGFVACQYLFHANRNYIATTVLFVISAAATIGWIESRYDSIKTTELSTDSSYTEKAKTLAELNNTFSLQNLSAKNDLANTATNFTGRANRTLVQAKQTQAAIQQVELDITQLKNSNPSSQKSGSAIANILAEWRWGLWALLAAMIDVIPMLCFAMVKLKSDQFQEVLTLAATLQETLQPSFQESLQESLEPTLQLAATPETLTPLLDKLYQDILKGEWGQIIPMKRIMAKHNVRHEQLKPIFDQLIRLNIIERQGNRFIRRQTHIHPNNKAHTQTKVQEQSA